MSERLTLAALGALSGATIGAPFHGQKSFSKLVFYEPIPSRMTNSLEMDCWSIYANLLQFGDNPGALSSFISNHQRIFDIESAFGFSNSKRGLSAPASGSFSNPLCEGSSAIGRAIFWGLIFEEDGDEAWRWSHRDASFDHSKDGVWIPAALAAMVAEIDSATTFSEIVKKVSSRLPSESMGHKAISIVLQCAGLPNSCQLTVERVVSELKIQDEHHSAVSLAIILASLATTSGADMALCATAGCGRSALSNSIATGVIANLCKPALPQEWIQPLGELFVAGYGLQGLEPPETIAKFVEIIDECQARVVLPKPCSIEQSDSPPPLPKLPIEEHGFLCVTSQKGELITTFEYLESPTVVPGRHWKGVFHFTNTYPMPLEVRTELEVPSEFEVATKLSSFRLDPGGCAKFPIVLQTEKPISDSHFELKVNQDSIGVPLLAPQQWHVAGPFDDPAQEGFDKIFPPERRQEFDETFSGRSGLTVKWETIHLDSNCFEVEPLFKSGPGVVVLYASLQFPRTGKYSIVAAGSPGVVVRIDSKDVVRYVHSHKPVARPERYYTGEFETNGKSNVLIKLLRYLEKAEPLTLYFIDDLGSIVVPKTIDP